MILLAVFLTAPLLANLPCVTGTCTGEGSCRICGEEKTGASGKDMSRSLNSMRVPGTGNASNGSLQVAISFGNVPNEHLSLPAEFSVYARDASPLVFSPQLLQYRNPLCERIAQPSDFYGYSDQKKKKWIDNFWKNFGLYILQSATKNCVPYRLLAGVVANEQLDYSWVENILEHFGMGNSLGPAQISVPTAISEGMIDLTPDAFQDLWSIGINGEVIFTSKYEMFNLYVRAKLLSIESNIDIAARLLRKNLNFLCDNFASGNISQSFFNDIMRGNPGAYYSLKKFCCQYKKGECNPKIIGTLPNAMAAMWNNGKNIIFVDDILHKSPNAYNHSRHAEEIYYYVERIHH